MMENVFVIIEGVLRSCCSEAEHIEIPEGVTKIGECAFSMCKNMQSVILPQSLRIIDDFAFLFCDKLKSVELPVTGKIIGKAAFKGCKALADSDGFVVVNHTLYDYCGKDKMAWIPEGVNSIDYEAFYRNNHIRLVRIPESVTMICDSAFDGCKKLVLLVAEGSYGEAYARRKGISYIAR